MPPSTPRPGCHIYYRTAEPARGSTKLALQADKKTLIEVKGEGGYCVAPGSPPSVHETGRPYRHISGPPITEPPIISVEEQETLLDAARTFNEHVPEPKQPQGETRREKADRNGETLELMPGEDFNERSTWEDILTPHGWTKVHDNGDKQHWRRPGKTFGTSATTIISDQTGNRVFCCFSSNAAPLDGATGEKTCTSYSPFSLFTVLKHGGDFSAAAKALAAQGFGQSRNTESTNMSHTNDESPHDDAAERTDSRSYFEWFTPEDFAKAKFPITWDIEGVLVHGQPCILVGPSKGLKTTVLMDAAVALGSGGHLLGRYKVLTPRTVAFMSCESGLATLKATLNRICLKAGVCPEQSNVHVCGDVPQLKSAKQLAAVKQHLEKIQADVFILDPLYRAVGGDVEASNLFAMGDLLGNLDEICQQTGTTLIVAHHAKQSSGRDGKSITLDDASWAGMQQFFRQWWTLSRRERYVEGSGEHRMIFTAGGSVGHSLGIGLDVSEGTDLDNRLWDVTIRALGELDDDSADRKLAAREEKQERTKQRQCEKDKEALRKALKKHPKGETLNAIRGEVDLSPRRIKAAMEELIEEGLVETCEVTRQNRQQPYGAYRLKEVSGQHSTGATHQSE